MERSENENFRLEMNQCTRKVKHAKVDQQKKKSQLKMGEKEASVTESNNKEYVHSNSCRKLQVGLSPSKRNLFLYLPQ